MDPILTGILTSLATNYFTQFTGPAVEKFFKTALNLKPELETKLAAVKTPQDIENFFKECVGVIDLNAGTGGIEIDGGVLEAVRGIRFDHAHGLVTIAGSTVSSQILVTGGGMNATGQTHIGGNTQLRSQGTSIQVGQGCSIKISGNARIIQS